MIRAETANRFAPAGFRATSFCPSYGLAEATLTVAACSDITGIRAGRTAAFVTRTVADDDQSVWLVAELGAGADPTTETLRRLEQQVKRRVASRTERSSAGWDSSPPANPTTTNGKVRVSRVRPHYNLAGRPFNWRYTKKDLDALLKRLADHAPNHSLGSL